MKEILDRMENLGPLTNRNSKNEFYLEQQYLLSLETLVLFPPLSVLSPLLENIGFMAF